MKSMRFVSGQGENPRAACRMSRGLATPAWRARRCVVRSHWRGGAPVSCPSLPRCGSRPPPRDGVLGTGRQPRPLFGGRGQPERCWGPRHQEPPVLDRLVSNDYPRSKPLAVILIAVLLGLALAPFLLPGVKALSV